MAHPFLWWILALAAAHPHTFLPTAQQDALRVQVMLDRAGFSPGEIDGTMGTNARKALDAFKKSGKTADKVSDPLVAYTISDRDAAGPFTPNIPTELSQQATLESLGYRDVLEALSERFHSSPKLLRRLNPGKTFAAGEQIRVPDVVDAAETVTSPQEAPTPSTGETVRDHHGRTVGRLTHGD